MDNFLTKIKDLKEQLIVADEVLSDSSLVQSFASTLCLMMKGNANALSFEKLVLFCCKTTSLGKIGILCVLQIRLLGRGKEKLAL